MIRCTRCTRPIEPGEPMHRTPGGSFHGACVDAETTEAADLDARRRRANTERRQAWADATERLRAELDPVRR